MPMMFGVLIFLAAPPPDSIRVQVSGIRWETYVNLWHAWMRHRGLPPGRLIRSVIRPYRQPASIDPRMDYGPIPESLRLVVSQFHDFFRYFLAEADLLFIGENVDLEVPPNRRQIFAMRTCPRVRYTYRIREILFSTGRIPAKPGDTLDFYGLKPWTGHYEAYADSIDRASREATLKRGDSIPPPPPSAISPVSVFWKDLSYPRPGDEAMFLSPHPVSPALIAVRLWSTLREPCERDRLTVRIRPPWTLDRLPGLWGFYPMLLAFRVKGGDTTFFFPLWRGWVWDRLTMKDVRWIARRFQQALNREKGGRP